MTDNGMPDLADVKSAADVMLKSDCKAENLRHEEALKVMQGALDQISPAIYKDFYMRGLDIPEAELQKIYVQHPLFYYYDRSFQKVLDEVKNDTPARGQVFVWLVYNMGIVVKTDKQCFGIDIHHRRAQELIPYLDFTCVTHNHEDHYTMKFLQGMNEAKKLVYSAFYPSYNGYSKEPYREIQNGELTIRVHETDHNDYLRKFVTPFEIVCGKDENAFVLLHSGDTYRASQLKPGSKKVDMHILHPYVGLDPVEAATVTVRADVTLIAHLQEMHHKFDQWRWTYVNGYEAADNVRAAGKAAWVPFWGEKLIFR